MKKEIKIPTLIGILFLGFSLGITVFLVKNLRSLFGRANPNVIPLEVKISNVSDSSFSVSWVTSTPTSGAVIFGENSSLGNTAVDDRDQITGTTGLYKNHHVTLRYLKPNTQYFFKIISGSTNYGNQNNEPYLLTTAITLSTSEKNINPVFGTVNNEENNPVNGAIVYLTAPGSFLLSTLTRSSGNWLIPLNNARTADLSNFLTLNDDDRLEFFIRGENGETSTIISKVANSSPVPQVILGRNYDFTQENSSSPTPTPQGGGFKTSPLESSEPALLFPQDEATIPDSQPLFKGTGIPGETITIKIESNNPLIATTTVNENGTWQWTPSKGLPPGEHKVTITTKNSLGNLVSFIRTFKILESGTQVAEAATPSATLKPSPTSTLLPTPTLLPSPLPTSLPVISGNLELTFLTLFFGLLFIFLGLFKILST